MPGETSNNQSNFNKHKVSLYAHLYEKYVEIKNVDGTVEITPDKYTWYNGGVVLEYVDCRPQPTCTGKRILLKQDMASLWDDVLRMNQTAGGTWTQEMAIQVESQLLLAMRPKIDLDPDSTLQGMKKYDPASGPVVHVHRELKTRKRKLNSYELEQEAAKKAKKEQMMFMMDERHGREFKPTFKLLPYFKSNRNKISTVGKGKQRVDVETAEQGRSSSASAKKSGRKLVRQLKFERTYTEAGDKDKVYKLFTLLNIYQEANGKHEAIFHSLYEKDLLTEGKYKTFMQMMEEGKDYKLDDSRASYRNELGNAEGYKSFIKSFVVLYSIDNNLKYDSGVDKVPVEMLTEVTTELTSPQTEMKFDKMKPYEIIELLAQQSDAEKTTSSNEGAKDLSVADLYNAAAKKAMQAKPSVSVPVNQDSSLMPPPQRPPARRNSRNGNSRARQTATTQAQIPTPVQSQNNSQMSPQFLMHRTGNQTPVQQQIPQTQMQQPQVMAASQSPNQRPMQSPALIQQNVPIQVPQSSTEGIHPVSQQISIPTITRQVPIQIPNAQGVPALMQRQLAAQSNIQGIPNVRPVRIIQNLPINQNIAQGTTIQDTVASPSMLNTRQKPITVRRTTQGQSQQMNVPVQTAQMNIPVQTNSSQMNQVQLTPQINIPTQPTDRVTSQLNVQSQMNQAQQAAQINIPAQISDQVNIQQTQTTPRIPGRVTPRMSAQTQMNQAQSTPQINIPAQISDQVQATPRINPAQVPQVNATDQMNVQISQMRMNPQRLNAINQVNQGRPISIQQYQQYHQQLQLLMANQNIQNIRFSQPITYTNAMAAQHNGYIRTPMNMQQSFMPSGQSVMMQSSFPMQNQLLPGQPSGISGIRPQIPMRQFLPHMLMQRQNPMISQQIVNQQLQNQWIFQQNQNQLPQQPQNQNWSGDGNASGKQ